MTNHGLTLEDADRLLDPIVDFPAIGAAFERVRPITDFRKDDAEARVLYICRRIQSESSATNGDSQDNLYVLKCKIQCVSPSILQKRVVKPIVKQSSICPRRRPDNSHPRPQRAYQR